MDLLKHDVRRDTASSISNVRQMHASTALAFKRQRLISGAELQLAIHTIVQKFWASYPDSWPASDCSSHRHHAELSKHIDELSLISDSKGSKVGSEKAAQNLKILQPELTILGYHLSDRGTSDRWFVTLADGVWERFWEQQGKH